MSNNENDSDNICELYDNQGNLVYSGRFDYNETCN